MIQSIGTFYKIPLGNNRFAFARLIQNEIFSFYKIDDADKTNEGVMQLMTESSPIFNMFIYNDVFWKSNWEIIGHKPLEEHILKKEPVFFRQDIADKEKCWLIKPSDPDFEQPVSPQECVNMEREAVWEYKTVEERLRDYWENKPNRYVEHFQVKI